MTASFASLLPSHMQAVRFYQPRDLRYETVPIPMPGPGELLVRIGRALTCGTDLKCFQRGHPVLLRESPSPFGHEFAGTVAAVGEGVTGFAVGQRVVSVNSAPCGHCFYCQKQQPNLCEALLLLNGAYADYIVVPPRIVAVNTRVLPPELPFEVAAFTEPLAVSLRAVAGAAVQPGDSVAVLGVGPIGQLIVKLASLQGAQVTALARSDFKLAMAQNFGGATQTVSLANGLDVETIRQRYSPEGRGFDAVIEAVGLPAMWEAAVALVRRGGRVHWFAGCPGDSTVTLSTRRIHYDEIRLVSLFHHTPAEVQQAFDLLANGTVDPRPLITQTFPLSQVEQALGEMEAGRALKLAIAPLD